MSFAEARACVIGRVLAERVFASPEEVALECAASRVMAKEIRADHDYPALARSVVKKKSLVKGHCTQFAPIAIILRSRAPSVTVSQYARRTCRVRCA